MEKASFYRAEHPVQAAVLLFGIGSLAGVASQSPFRVRYAALTGIGLGGAAAATSYMVGPGNGVILKEKFLVVQH
jgi:hypothetical protein